MLLGVLLNNVNIVINSVNKHLLWLAQTSKLNGVYFSLKSDNFLFPAQRQVLALSAAVCIKAGLLPEWGAPLRERRDRDGHRHGVTVCRQQAHQQKVCVFKCRSGWLAGWLWLCFFPCVASFLTCAFLLVQMYTRPYLLICIWFLCTFQIDNKLFTVTLIYCRSPRTEEEPMEEEVDPAFNHS